MHRIEIEADAEKALRRMPANTAKANSVQVLALAADPSRAIQTSATDGAGRLPAAVGNSRALYTIDPANQNHIGAGHQVARGRL